MKHLPQQHRWGFRHLSHCSIFSCLRYSPPCLLLMFLILQLEATVWRLQASTQVPGSELYLLPQVSYNQRLYTSTPLQLGWETGNEEDLFSSSHAHRGDVFQPSFFGVAVCGERYEHQNPVQIKSLLLWRCRSPGSDPVQLHLSQVSNSEFLKGRKVDLTIRIQY